MALGTQIIHLLILAEKGERERAQARGIFV